MSTEQHAAPHGRGMAWATLLVSGGISWGINLWHAFDQAEGAVTWWFAALATMYGTAPVVLAAFQSHSAAFVPMGKRKRTVIYFLVFLGMVLSVQAQAAAVTPFAGEWLRWVFPVFVDLSAFTALHTLMSSGTAARSGAVPVPAWGGQEDTGSAGPLEPMPVAVPVAPDGPVEPVPAAPTKPVPAVDRPAVPVPDRAVPAVRTGHVPADRTGPDRPGTADLTRAKDGDAAALERMDRAFAGLDPATVSVRQVRKELGAGHARADRLLAVWTARTTGADQGADRAGTGDGAADQDDADRTADRAVVPA